MKIVGKCTGEVAGSSPVNRARSKNSRLYLEFFVPHAGEKKCPGDISLGLEELLPYF
jgi:hypothetical protein